MAIHQNLKPSDQEIPLLLAGQALSRVDGLVSRPMGAVSVDNVDGSSTLIGGNTDTGDGDVSGGFIKQVGKTSLPGTPSGLSVSSVGLNVMLTWDGSFENSRGGAVRVEAVLTDADGTTISMGSLTGAGVLTALATVPGMASVAVTAYDDAHDQSGAAAPNHSDTMTLDIVLSELVDSQQITDTVEANRKTLEQANKDLAQAKSDIAANKTGLVQANRDLTQAQSDIAANKTGLVQANEDLAQAKNDIMAAAKDAQDAKAGVATAQSKADKAVSDAASALSVSASANAAAGQASSTAQSAKATADSAKSTADKAAQTASSATSVASTAQKNAATALTSANTALQRAKNITVSSTAPANPATGDIWYPQDDSGRVIGMKTWGGTGWVDVTIMAGSIIVPGSIGSTLIGDGQITTGKLAAGSVTADSMAADAVTARSLAVGDYTNLLDDSLLEKTSTDNQLASRWEGHNLSWVRDANVPGGTGNVLSVRKIKDEKYFNPWVQNTQPIPCKGGDTFYAGAYVWYWNDVKTTMKVQLKVQNLDNKKTYWLNAGIGTADIGQWQWVDGAATIPASAGRCIAQIFIFAAGNLNQWTDKAGTFQLGYYMAYSPVLRHGVGGTQIADGAVSTSKIIAGSITGDRLAANSVNADKLVANSVTADKLAANSVTADKLAANSVNADKLVANSVTADKIAANAVNADKLAANSVTADKLAANSVTADKIVAGSITGDKLAANSVTADKIAANSITADKLNGRKLVGAEIWTGDPDKDSNEYSTYMHMQSVNNPDNPDLGYAGYLSFDVSNPETNHGSHSIGALSYAIQNDIPVPQGELGRWDRSVHTWYLQAALTVGQSGMGVKVNEMFNPRGSAVGGSIDQTNFPNCAYVEIQAPTIQFTANYMPYHSDSSDASGYLSAHRTLFHNDNQPSAGVITLNDDITKYWKLEFEFKTNDGVYFGMPVYRPSVGKRFNASTIWYGFDNLPWIKTRAYRFTGNRTINCIGENNNTYWRTGQQVLGRDWKVTPGDFISLTHVEGFFN